MEILKVLSPDQISALTPECLQVLLNNNNNNNEFDNDLVEMKYFFSHPKMDKDKYENIISCEYDNNGLISIKKLILKNHKINFYLLPSLPIPNKHLNKTFLVNEIFGIYGKNICDKMYGPMTLYTENELKNILPTGVDVDKVCYSQTIKPCNFLNYKIFYDLEYNNLKFLHPILLECAKHFYL
jgi:hypothetical protein